MHKQPNILFIFTDQQSLSAMSAAGNPYLQTPHLDSLAHSGVRFENSYCAAPVCGPARGALVTGRMPHEIGLDFNDQVPDPHIPTMGELLRAAGYETAWTGKWHLPEPYLQEDAIPGFTYLPIPPQIPVALGSDTDDAVADRAIEFLRRPHQRPFLLTVSLHNPHDICTEIYKLNACPESTLPPPEQLPPLPSNFAIAACEPGFIRDCRRRRYYGPQEHENWSDYQWRTYLYLYYRLTEQVDKTVGRILATLQAEGLGESTLVVFTSDHGDGMAAHHWVAKLMLWEEVVKVPLIARWKGVLPAGRVDREHLVSGVDLLPTFCDYSGIAPPQNAGLSLRPLIENPAQTGRDYLVVELQPDPQSPDRAGRMIRTRHWKYVVFSYGSNSEMLFDLKNDAGETINLATNPLYRDEILLHRKLLAEWSARANDRIASDKDCHGSCLASP
jgi:arylsulfatase A-like enzyme